jgi:hypothetical protein
LVSQKWNFCWISQGEFLRGMRFQSQDMHGGGRSCWLWQDAIVAYEKCLELQPDSRNAGQNRLLALNYVYPGDDPIVCREHEKWGLDFQGQFEVMQPVGLEGEDPERRLVVGYVSPDFFTHSVSYFAEAPLTHHNPERSSPPYTPAHNL